MIYNHVQMIKNYMFFVEKIYPSNKKKINPAKLSKKPEPISKNISIELLINKTEIPNSNRNIYI